jgi:hypothetical protein
MLSRARNCVYIASIAVLGILHSGAHASTVVTWDGSNNFNDASISAPSNFTAFTANQLTLVSGDGSYDAALNQYFQAVHTTFTLQIDLNNVWTTLATWTSDDGYSEQPLSDVIPTPIGFTEGLVIGIMLTSDPNSGNYFDPGNYAAFNYFKYHRGTTTYYQELFTFDDVASATPLPATLPLFASGLGAIGLLARHRKRKVATLAAT